MKELAPTGKLRVGVVEAPVATAFFVTKDAGGKPHGVTVDLAEELAASVRRALDRAGMKDEAVAPAGR